MDRYDLAWAAGFFDGEGWANAVGAEGRRTRQPQARVNQADPNGVPAVLLRFQAALGGLGRIGGPYLHEGRQDLYSWYVSSRGDVEILHHLLVPWLGQVKLLEFGTALERASASSRVCVATDEWRAWASGLYDGEGSTYLTNHRTHVGYRTAEARITQSSGGGAPEVLGRFLAVVGVGRVYGPYRQSVGNLDVYRWNASARADVETCLSTLWPSLGPVKRAQAEAVFAVTRSQAVLPRGREEWGRYKTHCINGHEYATARVRPYASRGRGIEPRDSHQCLQCAREQARERRKRKKRSAADDGRRSLSEQAKRYLLK